MIRQFTKGPNGKYVIISTNIFQKVFEHNWWLYVLQIFAHIRFSPRIHILKYHSIPNDFKRGVYCDIVTATCISFTNYIDYEVMTK